MKKFYTKKLRKRRKNFLRRLKGFTLAEILTGLLLQALFILVLCGTFYLLVSFGSGTQQILTARERGQRVISYFDSRIRNAGLGMSRLTSSNSYRTALEPLVKAGTDEPNPLALTTTDTKKQLRLPVAITDYDIPIENNLSKFNENMKKASVKSRDKGTTNDKTIIYGNILTLIYSQKEEPKSQKNLVIVPVSADNVHLESKDEIMTNSQKDFMFIDFESNSNPYNFYNPNNDDNPEQNIDNWAALVGTEIPLNTRRIENQRSFKTSDDVTKKGYFVTLINKNASNAIIHAGDELLHLRGERLFVADINDNDERNFRFQTLTNDWGRREPHQRDILEIYMELDTETNIFTLWVLASGGKDSRKHKRPSSWPDTARPIKTSAKDNWDTSDYCYHVVYVSKASWKLHNIPNGFVWN